jgi:hypothetical protein
LEVKEEDWTRAAEAAERGLEKLAEQQELLFLAGYARNRLGRRLGKEFQYDLALAELLKAEAHLKSAIESSVVSDRGIPRPGSSMRLP